MTSRHGRARLLRSDRQRERLALSGVALRITDATDPTSFGTTPTTLTTVVAKQRLALSTLSGRRVVITGIRSQATSPGLREHEATFLRQTEGSAIRRIGLQRWRRNLAVALGNAFRETGDAALASVLAQPESDTLVAEHMAWALAQHGPVAG